jgi:hypothetical protein
VLRSIPLACSGLVLAFCLGCGPSDGLVSITGTVRVDGQAVDKGAITFVPLDGKSPTAGAPISSGSYSARVPAGKMKVQISVPKVTGKRKAYDTPDSPEVPIMGEGLPARYNSATELQCDVSKPEAIDFDLSTKP